MCIRDRPYTESLHAIVAGRILSRKPIREGYDVKASTSTVSTENEAAEELRLLGEILSRKILPWAPLDGLQPTPIEGLELIRSDTPTTCVSSVYEPSLCLIAQGGKTVWLGDKEIVYGPLSCLVSSVHLPVLGQVTQASPVSYTHLTLPTKA